MSTLPFWKVESIGNDFVLVHLDDVASARGEVAETEFLTDLAERACPRRFGVGSDGLLAIGQEPDGSLQLRMFNPDGTEDFCGNGIRCGFDHALRQGWVQAGEMRMTHHGVPVVASASDLIEHARAMGEKALVAIRDVMPKTRYLIHFQLPPASYRPKDIPIAGEDEVFDATVVRIDGDVYSGSVLSTGTAHAILPARELPGDEEFFRVSPQIERHQRFPERTSVMWMREIAKDKIELRIWERGVGETRGCGSGSTAAAIDYLRRKNRGGSVTVFNPGGFVNVTADRWSEPPRISGTATERFAGELPVSFKMSVTLAPI